MNDVMHRKRAWRILGVFEKKVSSWELDSEREGSTFRPHRGQTNLCATGAARDGGGTWKIIIERLCISLPNDETFNSKVIKGFVPELRSRYVFFVFRDSYVLCLYVMNIVCTFPIFMAFIMAMVHTDNSLQIRVQHGKRAISNLLCNTM